MNWEGTACLVGQGGFTGSGPALIFDEKGFWQMADLETKNSAVATEESGERKVKMRSLALDLVPMGSDDETRRADLIVTKTLPEGIES